MPSLLSKRVSTRSRSQDSVDGLEAPLQMDKKNGKPEWLPIVSKYDFDDYATRGRETGIRSPTEGGGEIGATFSARFIACKG